MSNGYIHSAQTSVAISVQTSNSGLALSFTNNGIALQQSVNPNTGAVSPDWSVAANQPIRTPEVTSARGETVILSDHRYKYGDVLLLFNGASSGGWQTDSSGKFALQASTGAIKVVSNLASLTNLAGDNILYECKATINRDGKYLEFIQKGSLNVDIVAGGESSYYGALLATTQQLTTDNPSATISSQLGLAGMSVANYYPKWLKHTTTWPEKNGQKNITVTRDDVNGAVSLVCEFYLNQGDTIPVSRVGIGITDRGDEMVARFLTPDGTALTDTVASIRLIGGIYSQKTGIEVNPSESRWVIDLVDTSDMSVVETVNSGTMTVTKAMAAKVKGGMQVNGSVEFNI